MTREEAKDTLSKVKTMLKLYPKRRKQKETVNQLNEAIDMAIEALSAEAVQGDLVRGNECKHYRAEYGSCTAEHWDLSRVTFPHVEPNDYCSYGEKKK